MIIDDFESEGEVFAQPCGAVSTDVNEKSMLHSTVRSTLRRPLSIYTSMWDWGRLNRFLALQWVCLILCGW
jgi:hypothetical protein